MTTFALLGFIRVVVPASVKLSVGWATLYAMVRLSWGFWQA